MIYTKDNPKLINSLYDFEGAESFTGVVKDRNNNIAYYLNGRYHRIDAPAREWASGSKEWYLNGKPHRTDGPAIEYVDGTKEWCLNGKLHREDGPALEYPDGHKCWYLNSKYYGSNDDYTNESWIRFVQLELLK